MCSDLLEAAILDKLEELSRELQELSIEESYDGVTSFSAIEVARFIKGVALKSESAELLLRAAQLEELAEKTASMELERYGEELEEFSEDYFTRDQEAFDKRQGWLRLNQHCNQKILNSEEYVVELTREISIFKNHEAAFYEIGVGHRIDNYLSRQATQYRLFLLCKNSVSSKFSGIHDDFPSDEDFDQVFEEAKARVQKNASAYMDKYIEQLKKDSVEVV